MTTHACKQCGRAVVVLGEARHWACEHEGGTIVANMDAVVSADGGVGVLLPAPPKEGGADAGVQLG